jgi:hypothetical protein
LYGDFATITSIMEKIGLRLPARTGGGHTEIAFWETESGETAIFVKAG